LKNTSIVSNHNLRTNDFENVFVKLIKEQVSILELTKEKFF